MLLFLNCLIIIGVQVNLIKNVSPFIIRKEKLHVFSLPLMASVPWHRSHGDYVFIAGVLVYVD